MSTRAGWLLSCIQVNTFCFVFFLFWNFQGLFNFHKSLYLISGINFKYVDTIIRKKCSHKGFVEWCRFLLIRAIKIIAFQLDYSKVFFKIWFLFNFDQIWCLKACKLQLFLVFRPQIFKFSSFVSWNYLNNGWPSLNRIDKSIPKNPRAHNSWFYKLTFIFIRFGIYWIHLIIQLF